MSLLQNYTVFTKIKNGGLEEDQGFLCVYGVKA